MNNLLSIFIPTYNRCNVLDTVLDRVISAVKEYDVCVQVYDNCSLDKTENIVCAKQKLYPYIFYCKNETNIGLDRNMLNVLNKQVSKYTLMLGDDDFW
ncbi:glycosyltransferase [Bacteroides fragilis]|uniref:glycosyltransferase n=1 Tax=Bacteroides hominis TaxID=2763023 RepID=UPI0029414DD0|nr:glycosyltransferase [Bacteroides fragilis]